MAKHRALPPALAWHPVSSAASAQHSPPGWCEKASLLWAYRSCQRYIAAMPGHLNLSRYAKVLHSGCAAIAGTYIPDKLLSVVSTVVSLLQLPLWHRLLHVRRSQLLRRCRESWPYLCRVARSPRSSWQSARAGVSEDIHVHL